MSTYFEMVAQAQGKSMSVCLARRPDTKSSPFISSLELVNLEDSMYLSLTSASTSLSTVTRQHHLGAKGEIISYPDDQYNRYWAPFMDGNPTTESSRRSRRRTSGTCRNTQGWLKAAGSPRPGKKADCSGLPPERSSPATTWRLLPDPARPAPLTAGAFDVAMNGKDLFWGSQRLPPAPSGLPNMMQLAGKIEISLHA
ncbi:hypothetical protein ZWY2020_016902 [Hordeum vulgare]|nr:hypothetical protein ZWY2020_016902 [Hordeum vulgare]